MAAGRREATDLDRFDWWIENHQPIITNILRDSPLKALYYGGFALNVQLGLRSNSPPESMLGQYRAGTAIVNDQRASDIDIKLFGAPVGVSETNTFLKTLLAAADIGTRDLSVDPSKIGCVGEPWSGDAAQIMKDGRNFCVLTGPIEGVGLLGVIATLKMYGARSEIEPGYQIIIKGIRADGNDRCQVLSELTVFSAPHPGGEKAPPFEFMPVSILCDQFIVQFNNLMAAASKKADKSLFPRLEKTLKRIEVCAEVLKGGELTELQAAFDATKGKRNINALVAGLSASALVSPPPGEGGGAAGDPAVAAAAPARKKLSLSLAKAAEFKPPGLKGGGVRKTRRSRRKD